MALKSARQSGLAGFTKYRSLDDASGNPVFYGTKGMILMKPTSITYSGTSASLGANGQVTFSAVTSLSLNGCFTADFDNYVVSCRHTHSSSQNVYLRVRSSGSDNSTASSYVSQELQASSTSVTAGRVTQSYGLLTLSYSTQRDGFFLSMYGPFLAQPTAYRSITAIGGSSALISDVAATHNQSTSYDGFTIYPASGDITGAIQVYGVRS